MTAIEILVILAVVIFFVAFFLYYRHLKKNGKDLDGCDCSTKGKEMQIYYQAAKKKQRKNALKFKRDLEKMDKQASKKQ